MSLALLVAYSLAALVVALYALAQLDLLRRWRALPPAPARPLPEDLPFVTVQLPLYNEPEVVERLLQAVAALDWPRDRLEVQVLDDSTDHTPQLVARALPGLRAAGLDVTHLRRADRAGFKAGALARGLPVARGELIALLDADFVPAPDWLRQALARLGPDEGLVQCRWAFLNGQEGLLARVQAFHLDLHFTLEQQARGRGGLLMGFNGTAGVWRRAAIEAAGGWEGDTLTEDLDLAYRAQLAGQKLSYVDEVAVPGELPVDLAAIRSQQHRWMKGGAQVARKLLPRLWRSRRPLAHKLHGTAHLLGSSLFLAVAALCMLLPLVPPLRAADPAFARGLLAPTAALGLSLVTLLLVYTAACTRRAGGRLGAGLARALLTLPLLLAFCNGLSLHNARATLEGWFGGTGVFVRTPKRGGAGAPGARVGWSWMWAAEAAAAAWSLGGAARALGVDDPVGAGFLALQGGGFLAVAALGAGQAGLSWRARRVRIPAQPPADAGLLSPTETAP